jgi:hypothetical protein
MEHRNVLNVQVVRRQYDTPAGVVGATGIEVFAGELNEGDTLSYLQRNAAGEEVGGSGCVDCIHQPVDDINPLLIAMGREPFDAPGFDFWVDDEGMYTQPINPVITTLLGRSVYGNVVIATHDGNGNTVGLSSRDAAVIVSMLDSVMDFLSERYGEREREVMPHVDPEAVEAVEMARRKVTEELHAHHADRATSDPGVKDELAQAIDSLERFANEGPF